MEQKKTLDETINELETLLGKMEGQILSLEDTFTLYNDGLKLVKYCNESIDTIEKNIAILNTDLSSEE
ncbi:MAG: Exonuclease small subunit [Clostridiales bacterium]|jgi:exodeoxyribonuclease VII small subunit|nr:Exonuclease small subunit [Clostridiales bacterium]